jgi:hypothetical protein
LLTVAGGEWVNRLEELLGLSSVGDVVLDGEVVVVTADGRADFELLAARVHGPRRDPDAHRVTFFVFDVLQLNGRELANEPWRARREILERLDLVARTAAPPDLHRGPKMVRPCSTPPDPSGPRGRCRKVRTPCTGLGGLGSGAKPSTRWWRRCRWRAGVPLRQDGPAGCC